MLLRDETGHVVRQLRGRQGISDVVKAPASKLSAEADVGVFGEHIAVPASGIDDGGLTPDTAGPMKRREATRAVACDLFDHEMTVQQCRLHARQPRFATV